MLKHSVLLSLLLLSSVEAADDNRKKIAEVVEEAEKYSQKNITPEQRTYEEAIERERLKEDQKQG